MQLMTNIKKKSTHFVSNLRKKRKEGKPLSAGWKGAIIALAAVTLIIFAIQGYLMLGTRGSIQYVWGTFVAVAVVILIGGVVSLVVHGLKKVPTRYIWIAATSFTLLLFSFIAPMDASIIVIIILILLVSAWGALIYKFAKGSNRDTARIKKIVSIVLLVVTTAGVFTGSYWIVNDGTELISGVKLSEIKTSDRYTNNIPDPAAEGPFAVKTLTYGSENSYRKVFNQSNSLITKPVDASAYVINWSSLRTKNVGFGPDTMPLNGMVWYPDGEGPFPLVVTVHGNHTMTDYSDPGYDYLGKLLASRGYIFVSVDENFLNMSAYDDMYIVSALEKENPARGLLMLEHIKAWKEWNASNDNPFFKKVDMNQIALIGHSRGGEGVTVAAAFNKLGANPENGQMKFDYNFNIRSVISVAGTDKQYKPSSKPTPLTDVNYLALQGAHDMDVNSFSGASQYNRVSFSGKEDYFKSTVYIYGANHGQFNRSWGRGDAPGLGNQLFNLKQLMPRQDQEKIAQVLISSFLDATLKNKQEYREIFKDIGHAKGLLPETMYVSNYYDSSTTLVSSYNEDIDLHSTTIPGGKLAGENFQEWKEEMIMTKREPDNYSAVRLGWDRSKNSQPAHYTVTLPNVGLQTNESNSFVFSMADGDKETNKSGSYKDHLIDLTITAQDKNGNKAALPLSHIGKLLPMIDSRTLKAPFDMMGGESKEPIFQNYGFSLSDFQKTNPAFNPVQLEKISFDFDQTEKGTVLIMDIGIRK